MPGKFYWTLFPEEIVELIVSHLCERFVKMRLLSSKFAIKYKPYVYCYSTNMVTMVHTILGIARDDAQMTTYMYSYLYSCVYRACTTRVANTGYQYKNAKSIYDILIEPGLIERFTQGMTEDNKSTFKRRVLTLFNYVNRSYVKHANVAELEEIWRSDD